MTETKNKSRKKSTPRYNYFYEDFVEEPLYEVKFDDKTAGFEEDILKENEPKISYLFRLFHYVFSSAKLMCGIFLTIAIVLSVLQPVAAFIWGRYIDSANAFSELANPDNARLISLIALVVLFWFVSFVNQIINRYLYEWENIERLSAVQDHRLQEKFQAKLFKKISKLYPDYLEVPKINDIINRSFESMGSEWGSLQKGVILEGYVIIAKTVSVAMVALSLYFFNPALCFIVLIAPIPTLFTTYIGNRLSFKFMRNNARILREAGYYQEVLLGAPAKEVKALNLFDFFFAKWKKLADDYIVREKRNNIKIFFLGLGSGFIANAASIAANVFAIILMTQGKLSIGALGAVLALIGTLMTSTSMLFASIANFLSKKNESAQFFELIDLNEQFEKTEKENAVINIEKLETKNISYRYPLTDEYILKNVNFSMKKGEKIAFVGENGAGKSTFIKIISGMLDPSGGEIFINGESTGGFRFSDKYNSFACVFQDPSRYVTFTIADNVFLGNVGIERNEAEIDRALDFCGFEGPPKTSLLGKDIGGTDLSGGQWQKLAIARAYYRNRDFIILDEPTSNLDPFAETEVFKKYIEMTEGKTLIMVTHRISVASLADRVVVFKDGQIAEDGAHEDLLAKNGEYARLYHTQAKWYDR